jgi:hypothetical protein
LVKTKYFIPKKFSVAEKEVATIKATITSVSDCSKIAKELIKKIHNELIIILATRPIE